METTNSAVQVAEVHLNRQTCKIEFITVFDLVESVKEMLEGASAEIVRDACLILNGYRFFRWSKYLELYRIPLQKGGAL